MQQDLAGNRRNWTYRYLMQYIYRVIDPVGFTG